MHDISALGINVVRTWWVNRFQKPHNKIVPKSTPRAFNDVTEIPNKDGVWFQVFHKNGTIEINEGNNGLVRLDNIVKAAKDNKLHVVFSLTNNWSRNATGTIGGDGKHKTPNRGNSTITPEDRRHLPRNFLSNDYGYVYGGCGPSFRQCLLTPTQGYGRLQQPFLQKTRECYRHLP